MAGQFLLPSPVMTVPIYHVTRFFMPEITLNIDSEANRTVQDIMGYYNLKSEAEVFGLGLKLIGIAASIDDSDGEWELIARNGSHETKISCKAQNGEGHS